MVAKGDTWQKRGYSIKRRMEVLKRDVEELGIID